MVITCKPSFFGIRRSSRRTSGEPIGQDGSHTQPDLEISLSSLAKPAMTKSCSVFSRISRSQDETSADNARRNRSIQHEGKPHRLLCELAFWHEKHPLQAGGVKNESVSRHYRADQNWTVGLLAGSTGCLATGATGEEVKLRSLWGPPGRTITDKPAWSCQTTRRCNGYIRFC